MPREDWRDRPPTPTRDRDDFGQGDYSNDYAYDPQRRTGYRVDRDVSPRTEDYGQGDYSTDYVYDYEAGRAYRRGSESDPRTSPPERRSFLGGMFGGGRAREPQVEQRRGPSDRVLWAIIAERLDDERRLDLRDVEVVVQNAEVTLNGTVRHKDDKRRIEDVADIEGVRNVQNNLRLRERGWF